jgi:hypothetical protein
MITQKIYININTSVTNSDLDDGNDEVRMMFVLII